MGLRVTCPNGHRLHLKSFLAGKLGICPQCQIRFRIPPESPEETDAEPSRNGSFAAKSRVAVSHGAPAGSPPKDLAATLLDSDEFLNSVFMEPTESGDSNQRPPAARTLDSKRLATQKSAPKKSGVETLGEKSANSNSAEAASARLPVAKPQPQVTALPPTPPPAADALDEAGSASWHVRPPGGGQFGPADGATLRAWVQQGRVNGATLLWREGWSQWKMASEALPELVGAAATTGPSVTVIPPALGTLNELSLDKPSPKMAVRNRKSSASAVGLVVFLLLVSVGLISALIFVLM